MGLPIEKITSILLKGFGSQKMEDIGFFPFLLLLLLSLIAAMIVSYLYLKFYKNRAMKRAVPDCYAGAACWRPCCAGKKVFREPVLG